MNAVAPINFGMCNRGGTDSLVHLVQFLLEEDPGRVVLSIDGVGAFDHVSRTRFFEELLTNGDLNNVLPFVRQWYAGQTEFVWYDSEGQAHQITQGEGGEQGDALMPALFCLALRRALDEVQSLLPAGCSVFAYLDDIYIYIYIYIICHRDGTMASFQFAKYHLRNICHIDVHHGKLAAWSPTLEPTPVRIQELGADAWKSNLAASLNGIKVLGTPIGTPEYIRTVGLNVVSKREQLLSRIPKLSSLQTVWFILYSHSKRVQSCFVNEARHFRRSKEWLGCTIDQI